MKLTEEQVKKIKPLLTKLVNEVKQELKEETKQIDPTDLKSISNFVNVLGNIPNMSRLTNDAFVKQKEQQVGKIRIEIMNYVEENSAYKFIGNSGKSGWKLVKK